MRRIGIIPQQEQAKRFSDFLCVQNIEHRFDFEEETGDFSIWIENDHDLEKSKILLENFLQDPQNSIYRGHELAAQRIRKQTRQEEIKSQKLQVDVRTHWHKKSQTTYGSVNLVLIGLSVLVSIFSITKKYDNIDFLFIQSFFTANDMISFFPSLTDVMRGQVWRLFTPMLIHFNIFHILFNMLWLKDLGNVIENKKGSIYFLSLVLVIAGISNVAQFFQSGPLFGGMSGVVYGLFGYLWMKSKFDFAFGMQLNKHVIIMMLLWFVICLTGWVGPIANTAHGVGLLVGVIWGYASSPHWKRFFRR